MRKYLLFCARLFATPAAAQQATVIGPTNAATVTTAPSSTNASFFPLFVPSNSAGNQAPSTSSGLSYNPAGGNLTATNLIGATTITNSSLTAGRIVLTTTSGQETDSSLFQYSTPNKEFVLNGAGSDTIVGGPGLSWNAGSGDVQHFQLGASNQLCLWGDPSSWQQNLCVGLAGAISMPQLAASSAAQTGTVCWTTGTGNLTVDTTTTCLASLEETKNIRGGLNPATSLWEILRLRPFWFSYKNPGADQGVHAGMGAHQVEGIDPRLTGYDPNGKLQGVRYADSISSLTVSAIQALAIIVLGLIAWNILLTMRLCAISRQLKDRE